MRMLQPEDFYHTGIVVRDVAESMRRLTGLGGYRWTRLVGYPFTIWTPEGESTVTFRFVYSIEAPHLELVEEIPGTVWTSAPGNAAHHLGYFVDDLAAASRALTEAGLPVEACGSVEGSHPSVFAYHKGAEGIRIEIVDRTTMGDFGSFLRANAAELGEEGDPMSGAGASRRT